ALTPAQPYIASEANVELRSGEVSTAGRLTYRAGRDRPAVTYTGTVDVNGVKLVETPSGDPVVAWRSMHAETLRFGLAPDGLEINEVRLAGLDGKIVIFKDKTVSVAKLVKSDTASVSAAPAKSDTVSASAVPAKSGAAAVSASPATAESAAAPGFPV